MAVVPHLQYYPDLAHCNFALFPEMKLKSKGRQFSIVDEIQKESQAILDSPQEKDIFSAFEAWKITLPTF